MHIGKTAALIGIMTISLVNADGETFNIFGSIGAGFGMGGELSTSYERETLTGPKTKVKDRFFNYGSGLKLDVGMQYFMMENVALQAGFGYSAGIPTLTTTITEPLPLTGSGDSTVTTKVKFHLFGIKVCVVPNFEVLDLLDVYVGAGFGFFWNARSFETTVEKNSGTQSEKGKIKATPTIGLLGLLGANYPLTDKLTLFGELGFEQIRFNLKKRVISESTINPNNEGTSYYSKDDPDNLDPVKAPGSNFQIRVGVRFALM